MNTESSCGWASWMPWISDSDVIIEEIKVDELLLKASVFDMDLDYMF